MSRQKIIQALFEADFRNIKSAKDITFNINLEPKEIAKITELFKNQEKINQLIVEVAPEWPINKISKADLAILRLAIYELSIAKHVPVKVIIDEAVELAKEFGGETSSRFINGALGKAVKKLGV